MKGVVSAQNALLKGSKTKARDLLEGTQEYNILPDNGVIVFPSRQTNDFIHKKRKQKNIDLLVGRPAGEVGVPSDPPEVAEHSLEEEGEPRYPEHIQVPYP